jgi:hypothetical protein
MIKNLVFSLLLLPISTFASISIVSDLDDTIKITNSGDTVDGAYHAALKSDVFSGISEFLYATRDYSNELHILSASPRVLKLKIEMTLKKRYIQYNSIILRNLALKQSKLDYKVASLKALLEKSSDDFILIGDDVGQDPEAYAKIQELYPNRILAIYIHVIKNRDNVRGTKYWTTYDLFLREYEAGRMRPAWVEKGYYIFQNENNLEKIFPDFAHCPTNLSPWSWQESSYFAPESLMIATRLVTFCQARSSSILILQ